MMLRLEEPMTETFAASTPRSSAARARAEGRPSGAP